MQDLLPNHFSLVSIVQSIIAIVMNVFPSPVNSTASDDSDIIDLYGDLNTPERLGMPLMEETPDSPEIFLYELSPSASTPSPYTPPPHNGYSPSSPYEYELEECILPEWEFVYHTPERLGPARETVRRQLFSPLERAEEAGRETNSFVTPPARVQPSTPPPVRRRTPENIDPAVRTGNAESHWRRSLFN